MSSGEHVIAVMGPAGVGKSSFIQNSVLPGLRRRLNLESETSKTRPVSWVNRDDTRITLLDTPSFDYSCAELTDTEVLQMITACLTNERVIKYRLTGLVYLHRITDTQGRGTLERDRQVFRKLCAAVLLKNIVIVTTMWDKVSVEEGEQREKELRSSDSLFKSLLDCGATMMRYDGTSKSAADVINHLLGKRSITKTSDTH
ncbi:hypothetical protein J3A83DRAFT_1639255 [Scleroderma citrinum]